MKRQGNNEDGVSPVIGTILLVAITIVLVAIVSVSAIGIAGEVGNTHVVGINVFFREFKRAARHCCLW